MRFDYTHSPQLFLRIAVIDDADCGIPDGRDAKFEAAFGKFALGEPIDDENPKMRRFDLGFLWFAANRMIGKGLERESAGRSNASGCSRVMRGR